MMRKLRSWFSAGAKAPQDLTLPLDPLAPEFLSNPAPIYAALRQNTPLAPLASGGFLLTRAADIDAVFSDPCFGNAPSRFSALAEKNRARYTAADVAAHIPPFLDKPAHVPARQALSHAFFKAFAEMDARLGDLAQSHVEKAPAGDLIAETAQPYVEDAMARFIGLPQDRPALRQAAQAVLKLFAPVQDREAFEQTNRALAEARQFVKQALEQRAFGQTTLLGQLTQRSEAALPEMQVVDLALLVLADGFENVEAGIGLALHRITHTPGAAEDISLGKVAMEDAVAECLRLESPAQIIPRVVRTACTLHGQDLPVGTPIFLALGSANLDPEVFDDPLSYRPGRDTSRVFGKGRHGCIGAPLATAMICRMIEALLQRGARTSAAPSAFHARFGHRWPVAIPISSAAASTR